MVADQLPCYILIDYVERSFGPLDAVDELCLYPRMGVKDVLASESRAPRARPCRGCLETLNGNERATAPKSASLRLALL